MQGNLLEDQGGLSGRLQILRGGLNRRTLSDLAARTGAGRQDQCLAVDLWNRPVSVGPPEWEGSHGATGRPLEPVLEALLIYYLSTADGTPPAGEWIDYRALPDGQFYATAFHGYTGGRLARHFGADLPAFLAAGAALGGTPFDFGDGAFQFALFPHLPILCVGWSGDETIGPSYRLLFDAHACHQLPTDACAVLGSYVTGRLLSPTRSL